VVYRGFDSDIHELSLNPGASDWQTADLTNLAGAPSAAGDPAAYARFDNVNSVVYRGFDEHIHELYLDSGAGVWQTADLSALMEAPPAADPNKFDFRAFADALENNLAGNAVGYSFSVSYLDQWNNMRAGGQARTHADPPAFGVNPEVRFSTASMSKTTTAAAALKLLTSDGSPGILDNPIGPYLPIEFNADGSFGAITFRQLLQHRSGIGNVSDARDVDYNSLIDYISSQPNVSDKTYHYSNTNHALFRFLIPALANMPLQPGDRDSRLRSRICSSFSRTSSTPSDWGRFPRPLTSRAG
jgi:hypothetical protein